MTQPTLSSSFLITPKTNEPSANFFFFILDKKKKIKKIKKRIKDGLLNIGFYFVKQL